MTTNKFNIPEKFTKLINKHAFETCKDINRYSISKLLGNIRENVLNEQFEGDEDVSDRVPALLGTMMHYYFENKVEGGKHETKLEAKLDCYTIVGILDCYEGTKIIDYKLKKQMTLIMMTILNKLSYMLG